MMMMMMMLISVLSYASAKAKLLAEIFSNTHIFLKQLESRLSPSSCFYFQGFWGSELLNDCLVL